MHTGVIGLHYYSLILEAAMSGVALVFNNIIPCAAALCHVCGH